MSSERADDGDVGPTSAAWRRYYDEAAKRRRQNRSVAGPKELHAQRKRRKQLERLAVVGSICGLAVLAWIFEILLSR
jgi:hypothetical protein